jgi:dihydroflavonol-4-reductase
MSELTFLTGATGFVGAAVARTLIGKGHRLRLLCRANNDRRNLDGLDAEIVEGDLADPGTFTGALKGCQNLFHVAADYRLWTPDVKAMHRINVDGTRVLMEAALAVGIERIVYTSSVATLGLCRNGLPSTEQTPVSFADMIGSYKKSKFLAEQEVLRLVRDAALPAIIVNPATPLGPRDIKPTPTGRIVIDAVSGRMPAYVDTGLNIVHVEDVAYGHWLAFEQGRIGERYILGGDNLSLCQILGLIATIEGPPAPKIQLPCNALYPLALCMEAAAHFTGREPRMTIDTLRMAKNKMFFSSAKAEQQLGYQARPAQQAIADAIAWFRAEGYF